MRGIIGVAGERMVRLLVHRLPHQAPAMPAHVIKKAVCRTGKHHVLRRGSAFNANVVLDEPPIISPRKNWIIGRIGVSG